MVIVPLLSVLPTVSRPMEGLAFQSWSFPRMS